MFQQIDFFMKYQENKDLRNSSSPDNPVGSVAVFNQFSKKQGCSLIIKPASPGPLQPLTRLTRAIFELLIIDVIFFYV